MKTALLLALIGTGFYVLFPYLLIATQIVFFDWIVDTAINQAN